MRGRLFILVSIFLVLVSGAAARPTGAFFHNGSLELSDINNLVKVEPGEPKDFNSTNGTVKVFDREHGLNLPTGYIVLILAFLLIVVYAVDIDPFWIAILLFFLAVTAIVYYLRLPKYIVPLLAVLVLVVKHFR
ncbi:MAG: hypothetical protein ABEJ99_00915 [Candidatus Nanohaloarchaea archaeon]